MQSLGCHQLQQTDKSLDVRMDDLGFLTHSDFKFISDVQSNPTILLLKQPKCLPVYTFVFFTYRCSVIIP